MTAPRGIRNRNPGNIVLSTWTMKQDGCVGPEPQGRFAVFDTMANGVKALLRLLLVYRDQHKLKTVRGIINRWAPPSENDTSAYSITVAKAIGVGLDDPLPADADTYIRLARAIVIHENGRDAAVAVTDEDYAQAAASVFLQAGRSSPSAEQVGGSGASPSPTPASATQPDRTDGSPAFLQPEWPFEGTTMPLPAVASIGLAMLPELLSMAPAIVRLFGKSDNSERNAKALEIVGPKLAPIVYGAAKRAVPDAVNEQDVVEKLRADPELQKKFNAELAADYDRLLPLLDKAVDIAIRAQQADDESRDKAAARVKGDPAMAEATPLLIRFALSMLTGVIVLLVALMGVQVWITDDHKPSVELIVLFVSIVSTLLGIAGTIYTYRFGSSSGSKASGDAVRAIAEATRR